MADMRYHGFALTAHDVVLIGCLEGAIWHLDLLYRSGGVDARADRVHDRLGFYGMGRN